MREIQPADNKGCFGYVASYVTGEPFSKIAEFLGHDASERGYTEAEIISYLLSRGYHYGSSLSFVTWKAAPEEEQGENRKKSLHLSESMFSIAGILALESNSHLRGLFDEMIRDFITEHKPDLPEARKGNANIIDSVSGIDGRELEAKARKIRQVTGNIPLFQPAVVIAVVNHGLHALYWDGENLFDPHFPCPVCLSKYTVLEWKPVEKVAGAGR